MQPPDVLHVRLVRPPAAVLLQRVRGRIPTYQQGTGGTGSGRRRGRKKREQRRKEESQFRGELGGGIHHYP